LVDGFKIEGDNPNELYFARVVFKARLLAKLFQSPGSQRAKDYKPSEFYHVDICSPIWFVPSLGKSRYIFALQR
jgi:hypothetical protein